jgi:hypothetical protein
MHYRSKGCKIDIDKVDGFLDLFDDGMVEEVESGEMELARSFLGGDTKVYVLRRKQS